MQFDGGRVAPPETAAQRSARAVAPDPLRRRDAHLPAALTCVRVSGRKRNGRPAAPLRVFAAVRENQSSATTVTFDRGVRRRAGTCTELSPMWRMGPSPITTSLFSRRLAGGGEGLGDVARPTEPNSLPSRRYVGLDRDAGAFRAARRFGRPSAADSAWPRTRRGAPNWATFSAVAGTALPARHEEVAAVARRFTLDLVAGAAEVLHFLQKDEFPSNFSPIR